MNGNDTRNDSPFAGIGYGPMILGLVGLAALGAAYIQGNEKGVLQSYVFGYICFVVLTLGCFGLTLLQHTIRAQWALPFQRLWEAGGGPAALLTMGILFLPIAFGMGKIFPWMDPHHIDGIILAKQNYLNQEFFLIRAAIYFLIWIGLASYLRASSLREDSSRDPNEAIKRTNVSAPSIVLFVITVTFAFTDWAMSLEPHWFSTVYGLWFVVGMALMAVSFATILVVSNYRSRLYEGLVHPGWTRDVGNMLLTLTMLWAYLTLSQFLIIWAANLKEEIPYYISRSHGGWNVLGVILIVGQFFAPFMALLAPRTKAFPRLLVALATWIFVMRFLDMFWVIAPAFRTEGLSVLWTDLAAVLGIGAIWLSVFGVQLRRAALLPRYDPRIPQVLEHA